jgi:cbb3-type cytochrome oxidase subunit 3
MKELVRALETGDLAQVGLIAFIVAFLLMVGYAMTRTKRQREDAKGLPLEDDEHVPTRPDDLR